MNYEPSVRSFTVFFSVLVSIGIKHILDATCFGADQWPCFILAILLCLRFLTGSANHMWFEFVNSERSQVSRAHLLRDVSSLTVFGVLALAICYSTSVDSFLGWTLVLLGAASISEIAELVWEGSGGSREGANWTSHWLRINVVQLGCTGIVKYGYGQWKWTVPGLDWNLAVTVLCLLSACFLYWDFNHQLDVLQAGTATET